MTKPRAFTLLELMVVIAIVGILSTAAVASMGNVSTNIRLHGSARGLAALLRSARTHALAQHARVRVHVVGGLIQLQACPARYGQSGCAGGVAFADLTNRTMRFGVEDARSVALTAVPENEVIFAPTGTIEAASALQIYKLLAAGTLAEVHVTTAGEVRVP
jgi:type II secretion system protein H